MNLFTCLYRKLDESNRTTEKIAALVEYFQTAPPRDAAWALWFLTGNRPKRAVNSKVLREWLAEEVCLPLWMIEECYDNVGDLAETMALLLPGGSGEVPALSDLVESTLLSLGDAGESARREVVRKVWNTLATEQLFVWHKLMMGGFRVGVSRTLVVRALAKVADIEQAEMAHRVMGYSQPTEEAFLRVLSGEEDGDESARLYRPYPFCLAHPIEVDVEALGSREEWIVEWKWDGIRAQLIRRGGEILVWSRGEELVTDRFPEIVAAARHLPNGTVLDGEILAWRDEAPMAFSSLQTRINRKSVSRKLVKDVPVVFLAYDLLESEGIDRRAAPFHERRERLENLICQEKGSHLLSSPIVYTPTWDETVTLHHESRERGVEGFMLKHRNGVYHAGRVKGGWWKWKVAPHTMDAVLVYAQKGHGRRANLFTDYTFAAWDGDALVPVAKAYSGLTDKEIGEVDAWIRRNTLDRHGPVRVVKPELVFELAFEGIQESKRHKSGIAVRFPRMTRWRRDKPANEADRLEAWKALLQT